MISTVQFGVAGLRSNNLSRLGAPAPVVALPVTRRAQAELAELFAVNRDLGRNWTTLLRSLNQSERGLSQPPKPIDVSTPSPQVLTLPKRPAGFRPSSPFGRP